MENILISACLLGKPVRYDGRSKPADDAIIDQWVADGRIVTVCPEVNAGMPTPRVPAEIVGGGGEDVLDGKARVANRDGEDVTEYFIAGARIALALCEKHGIQMAVLSESSPSCGSTTIYDGSFSRTKIAGRGVTAALLKRHGIDLFSQFSLAEADHFLESLPAERIVR